MLVLKAAQHAPKREGMPANCAKGCGRCVSYSVDQCGPCKKESVHVNRTDKVSTNLVTVALRKARIAVSDAAWRKNNPEYHSEYSKSCTLNLPLPQTCCVGYQARTNVELGDQVLICLGAKVRGRKPQLNSTLTPWDSHWYTAYGVHCTGSLHQVINTFDLRGEEGSYWLRSRENPALA